MPTIWERTSLRGLVLLATWGGDNSEVPSHEPSRSFRTYLCRIRWGDCPEPEAREVGISLSTSEQIGDGATGFVDVTVSAQSTMLAPAVLVLQIVQFMMTIGPRKRAKWAFALDASASKDHHFCIPDNVLHYGFHYGTNNALDNHIEQYNR